jgi:probable phosphoglycerate mutase
LRGKQGLNPQWDIWRDGCPGGEGPKEVEERLDRLIDEIKEKWHRDILEGGEEAKKKPSDILIVAHGHILRAFAMRWVRKALCEGPTFLLEAGGVGTLSYEHNNLDEPAILLGGGFVVDALEGKERK